MNATTAVQQSSRFAGPAFTEAVPKRVTVPLSTDIAANPIDDLAWDAGSRPIQTVCTILGATFERDLLGV